jgi:hypothetical protein
VGLGGSAADGEDEGPVSDRWAQAQPLTISTTAKIRNAMRKDKKKPLTKQQLTLSLSEKFNRRSSDWYHVNSILRENTI